MSDSKILLVIAGPTAVGKTALSVSLAEYFNTEIISADSRQFYKELNIGTAKPDEEELKRVKHHFINSHSITEEYNVGRYEADALSVIADIHKKHSVAILTGGSGLYIKAVCEGMDDLPAISIHIREELNHELEEKGLEYLVNQLKDLDPDYYSIVDKANPQRIIRALEVYRSSGKPFSSFRTNSTKARPFKVIKIGLNLPREELYQRIDTRMDQMLEKGLVNEVKSLQQYKNKNALQTVGYSEVFGFIDGEYGYEEMVRLLKQNSRRYAKRQLTWFNKDKEFVWFSPNEKEQLLNYIKEKATNSGE